MKIGKGESTTATTAADYPITPRLKLSGQRPDLRINFNTVLIKDSIKRTVR